MMNDQPPAPLSRLGFAVKVMGQPGLKSSDTRRWQKNPHLTKSCEYLDAIFTYLAKQRVTMYRLSSDIAPYATHPDMPQFHRQVEEADAELRALGKRATELGLRLSFHPSQYTILNSADAGLNHKSILDIESQATILDRLEAGPEGVIIVHAGGVYGDKAAAMARWAESYRMLSEAGRRRLVLENDDISYSAADALALNERTGVPLVFDFHHFCCHNPEGLTMAETAVKFMRTWPAGVRPKFHFSSPRTELRELKRRDRKTKKLQTVLLPPLWTGHADYNDPFGFIETMRKLPPDAGFDVMLEAKAKDLALRRLRVDLQRYAPDVAARFGLVDAPAPDEPDEIILTEPGAEKAEEPAE